MSLQSLAALYANLAVCWWVGNPPYDIFPLWGVEDLPYGVTFYAYTVPLLKFDNYQQYILFFILQSIKSKPFIAKIVRLFVFSGCLKIGLLFNLLKNQKNISKKFLLIYCATQYKKKVHIIEKWL